MSTTTPAPPSGAASAVLAVALAVALLCVFATWLVAVGMSQDCTTWYPCDPTGCPPCRAMDAWLLAGAGTQVVLAVVAGLALWRGSATVVLGLVLVAVSVAAIAVSTTVASGSYCRPGTPGFDESWCPGAPPQRWTGNRTPSQPTRIGISISSRVSEPCRPTSVIS